MIEVMYRRINRKPLDNELEYETQQVEREKLNELLQSLQRQGCFIVSVSWGK